MVYNGAMNGTLVSSTIKLNLQEGLLENASREARRIGISLQDFIRMLMATYFSRSEAIRTISRDQILLERAQNEIKNGKFTAISSPKNLEDYLNGLTKN